LIQLITSVQGLHVEHDLTYFQIPHILIAASKKEGNKSLHQIRRKKRNRFIDLYIFLYTYKGTNMFWYNWSRPSKASNHTDYNASMLSTTQHIFKSHTYVLLHQRRKEINPSIKLGERKEIAPLISQRRKETKNVKRPILTYLRIIISILMTH
jgi:hypothetical protein